MSKNLYFEKVTKDNLNEAIKLQNDIFPGESGEISLKASIDNDFLNKIYKDLHNYLKFWICKDDNGFVGMTGLYDYKNYPKDCWIGWIGVLSSKRKKGYGKEIFNWTLNKAKELGSETLRLHTSYNDNPEAIKFYRKLGMFEEKYKAEPNLPFSAAIFSISLKNNQVLPWENKKINIYDEILLEQKASEK